MMPAASGATNLAPPQPTSKSGSQSSSPPRAESSAGRSAPSAGGPASPAGLAESGDCGGGSFDSAAEAWADIQAMVDRHPGLGWLGSLRCEGEQDGAVLLRPAEGRSEIAGFAAAPRQRDLLERAFADRLGRRLRVLIEKSVGSVRDGSGARAEAGSPGPGARGGRPSASPNLADGRNLPLVKEALQAFPDATIVEVRRIDGAAEGKGGEATEGTAGAADDVLNDEH